jgi:hypothetical protein
MADTVTESQKLFTEALDCLSAQREQIAEDLRFSDPSDPQQWDETERRRREIDPGGARPCLVFDQLGQYVANVAGQVEQRPPAMHALPVDGGADRKVAEQLDGFFRHIEHSSRAQQHYARAATSAARAGVGYVIVRPEYVDRALGYQEPRITSEGDPLRIVFDPWSIELDGSDASFGYHLTPISQREFKRRWPKAEPVSFGSDDRHTLARDERESVMVAEEWRLVDERTNCIVFIDQRGDEVSLGEDDFHLANQRGQVREFIRAYPEKKRVVYWRRMSGAEVLDKSVDADGKEAAFPADGIGIVPMYGYIGYADGRMTYCGIPRRARSAQQAYNFHKSEERAYLLTAPKSPWIGPGAAFAPYKALWDRANVDQRAYLPYEHLDENGQPIPAPSRLMPAVNLQNHIQGSQEALRDIQASIGMYQANLGAPSNETSGVAIESRKQQGEASTAHFQSHLAAMVARVGQLCLQMLPRLLDTKRQMRTLGIDGNPGAVRVDPGQAEAMQEGRDGLTINPNVGRYDVRVVVGAAYSTQRTQAQAAFTEMMRANPQMAPALAPLWAQTLDVPHADKLAQVLTAMAPDPVRQILSPEQQGPTTAELTAQVDQLKQALQEATQIAQQATQEAEQAKNEGEQREEEAEARIAELAIKRYEAETKRLQVTGAMQADMAAVARQVVIEMLSTPAPDLSRPESQGPDGSMLQEMQEGAQPESYEMQPLPAGPMEASDAYSLGAE